MKVNKQLSFLKQLFLFVLMFMPLLQVNGKTTTEYKIWEYGKVSTLQGKGTQDDPYRISSMEDFATFSMAVNNGNSFEGKYIVQTADICLNPDAIDSDGNMSFDNLSTITYALPVGSKWGWSSDYFKGVYDGQYHSISGLYYSTEQITDVQWMGVFGGLKNAIVKNLIIKDSYFDLSSESGIENSFGMLAGRSENSIISDCEVFRCKMKVNNVESGTDIGGLIGHVENGATIMNCSLDGWSELNCQTTRSAHVGGLVGYCKVNRSSKTCSVNVKNSTTTGKINIETTLDRNLDGFMYSGLLNTDISAEAEKNNSTVNISGCTNRTDITVEAPTIKGSSSKKYKVTGMSVNSFANRVDRVEDCVDKADITFGETQFQNATGVVVAPVITAYNCMKNCALYGDVYVKGSSTDSNHETLYDVKVYHLYADKITSIENCVLFQGFKMNGNNGHYEKDVDEGVKLYEEDAQLQNEAKDICKEFNENSKEIHWGVNSTYPRYPLPIACGGEITDLYGSGTALDPYWISSEKSLRRLQELVASKKFPTKDKYFYLAADIDMTDSKPMEPIGISDESENTMFMGTFYGNGHAIIGMHTNDDGYGLFGYVGGTIQDLAVIGMTGKVASPLVYYLKGSEAKIQSCYVGGDIDFIKEGAGLCYHSDSGSSITNSYFKGTAHTPEKAKFAGICYSNNSMIDNCFASFNVETDEKVETDDDVQAQCIATTGTGIVNGCYGYINKVSEGVTKHYDSVVKEINSESDLNGLMKSPFVEGAYHPILPTTKHYDDVIFSYKTGNSDGDTNTKLAKLDAIPTDDGTNCISRYVPDAVSYNYNYKEDRLLWSLPNLAIYDAESNTDYLLNCTLNPEQGFVYNTYDKNGKKVENLNIKGSINFPLTLTGDADTYMLCLPGVVHKDNLPEGSRLMIVGKATELEKSCQANVVDCDSIPAGMPFLAYIPGEEGDVVNIVMRGDIATGPRTAIKVNGEWFNTDLTGSFLKWGGFNNSFTSVKGNQLIKSEEQTPGNLPAFSSAYILQNNNFTWTVIDLINYILLDETAADVDDIVKNYNDKNGINVKLKRSLKKGSWNTICLPFDVSGDDMKAFGADGNTTVEELTSVDSNDGVCTLHFTKATGIEAGKSYLIKQDADYPMVLEWNSRTIKNGFHSDPKTVTGLDGFNTVTFTGSFAPTYLVGDSSEDGVCFIQGDKIYKVGDGQHVAMKGFRCWLTTSNVDALKSARLVHSDGSTTDLRMVEIGSSADGSRIYDLQGIETVSPTKAGVYIKNGKKYVER